MQGLQRFPEQLCMIKYEPAIYVFRSDYGLKGIVVNWTSHRGLLKVWLGKRFRVFKMMIIEFMHFFNFSFLWIMV